MSNGTTCCAQEICCPPLADGSPDPRAVAALAKMIGNEEAARDVLEQFELADRGSLTALKASIVHHARHV